MMKVLPGLMCVALLSAVTMVAQMRPAPQEQAGPTAQMTPRTGAVEMASWSMRVTSKGGASVVPVYSVVRDIASGLPTGKRMHKPIVITMELDKKSPMWTAAMTSREAISAVELTLDAASKDAARVGGGAGKVSMQDLHVINVRAVSPTRQEVTLDYGSLQVTSLHGGGLMDIDIWAPNR